MRCRMQMLSLYPLALLLILVGATERVSSTRILTNRYSVASRGEEFVRQWNDALVEELKDEMVRAQKESKCCVWLCLHANFVFWSLVGLKAVLHLTRQPSKPLQPSCRSFARAAL